MTRPSWWLIDHLSRFLEPGERDAVCGDLAESGETGGQALIDVLGLVLRRHALLVFLVVPLGLLLTLFSRRTADGSAIYIWLYANNWDWNLLENAAFRHDFAHYLTIILIQYLTLCCASLASGLVFRSVSRRGLAVHGLLFGLTLLFGGLLATPGARRYPANAAVFNLAFYRVFFPLIVQAVLVLFPFLVRNASRFQGEPHMNVLRVLVPPAILLPVPCFCLFLTFAGIATAADQASVRASIQPANARKPAPEFALKDSSGKTTTLKKYRGKVVLLDFWATWCHGCKEEIPWFAEFERKYAPKGLTVLGVSLDEDGWKVVKPFLQTAKVPYRIVLGDDATARKYAIQNMPDTFLIDRHGRIAAGYVGLVDKDDVEANIRAILAR